MTRLLYPEEHLPCVRYDSGSSPLVEYIQYPKDHKWENQLSQTEILFMLEGSFSLAYEQYFDLRVGKGHIILLPPGCHYRAYSRGGCSLIVFRLNQVDHFCDRFSLERLSYEDIENEDDMQVLHMIKPIENYLQEVRHHHMNGLRCSRYHEVKVREFFYLLRAYYPKEQLAGFFQPLLSNNTRFMNFVLQNYKQIKTVSEFAELYNCSVSNFEKKFRHTFGMSPYKWMMQKRISVIYNEINTTDKPFRQIAKEQKFSSLPQFTDYCKKHFGFSPSKMRRLAGMGLVNGNIRMEKSGINEAVIGNR